MRRGTLMLVVVALALGAASPASAASVQVLGTPATQPAPQYGDSTITMPSYTVGAGNHRLLVVAIGTGGNAADATAVTFNGQAMALEGRVDGASNTGSELWSIRLGTSAQAVTGPIVATFSNNVLGFITAVAFYGADQTADFPVANSTDSQVTLTTNFGHHLIDAFSVTGGNAAVHPGVTNPQTQVHRGSYANSELNQWGGASTRNGSSQNGQAHGQTMTWNGWTSEPFGIAHTGMNISPAPDNDNDGVLNSDDNCPGTSNTNQANFDGDTQGDACDPDDDNDAVPDTTDNCDFAANQSQANFDGDTRGDVCDSDDDNDTVADTTDNCHFAANQNQADFDGDTQGDACDPDDDNDTLADATDNCDFVATADQGDKDNDGAGDACDLDDDEDQVADAADNCPFTANGSQSDIDADAAGDACDADDDGDQVPDATDNCATVANSDQANTDADGSGNACDADDDDDRVPDADDLYPLDPTRSAPDPSVSTSSESPAPVLATTPALTSVRLKATRFRRTRGTRLSFVLNAAATVRIVIKGKATGRQRGNRCSATARRGKRCTLHRAPVMRLVTAFSGPNSAVFGRGLKRGRYTATVVALDSSGKASLPVRIRFTVR